MKIESVLSNYLNPNNAPSSIVVSGPLGFVTVRVDGIATGRHNVVFSAIRRDNPSIVNFGTLREALVHLGFE